MSILLLFEEKDFYGALFLRFPFLYQWHSFFFFFEIDNSLKFLCILNHEEEKQFGTPILAPLVLVPDWQAISCIDFHFFLFFLLKDNIRQKPDIFIIKLYINFRMFVGK